MKRVADIIKKENYKHVILLYGEEDYLVRQAKVALKNALAGEDTNNLHVYSDKGVNVAEIIDMAETMPFFADRRVFVIERSGLFKSGNDDLNEYLKNPCETAYFIFAESDVDKRSKLFKTVSAEGIVLEFGKLKSDEAVEWIAKYLGRAGFKIRFDAAHRILDVAGDSLGVIKGEMDKLIAYCDGREEITAEDVEALTSPVAEDKIFEMTEALANKKQDVALKCYYDLLLLKEAPMKILILLERQLNLTLQAKILKEKRVSPGEIAKAIGVPPFAVKKYSDAGGGISKAQYKAAINACVKAEEDIVNGVMNDRIAVECVIMSILKE